MGAFYLDIKKDLLDKILVGFTSRKYHAQDEWIS